MRGKGRPKLDGIHPETDTSDKKVTVTVKFYPDDKKLLKEKLDRRGLSISEWIRKESDKIINERDKKERKKQLEKKKKRILNEKERKIEEIDRKINEIESKLETEEDRIDSNIDDLKKLLRSDASKLDIKNRRDGFVEDKVPFQTNLLFTDKEKTKDIIKEKHEIFMEKKNDYDAFVESVIQAIIDNKILEVKP